MGTSDISAKSLENEAASLLSREDGEAAAAAIAAAAAAAAADGLVLTGSTRGPDPGSDSDPSEDHCLQSPSVESHTVEDGLQQRRELRIAKHEQPGAIPSSEAHGEASTSQQDQGSDGFPFRRIINAACTSSSLQRLAEAFRFIDASPCICADPPSCKFGGEAAQQQQQKQRQILQMLTQEDAAPSGDHKPSEADPFSLFANTTDAVVSSCCIRHPVGKDAINNNNRATVDMGQNSPLQVEATEVECDWESFAVSLDKDLDNLLDSLEDSGILEKMQNSLAACLTAAVYAFPKVQEARAMEAASQVATCGNPTRPSVQSALPTASEHGISSERTPAETATPSAASSTSCTASTPAVVRGADDALVAEEEQAPSVESGGVFAAITAVEAHCNEIAKKFASKLSTMRRVNAHRGQTQILRQPMQSQTVKPYQPLPAYARGQQIPLFPYRYAAPSPPSLLQLRDRRSRLQVLGQRKGAWAVKEYIPHINASFPDAAWFSLGCCAGRTWRQQLLSSGLTARQQLEMLRLLQGDDLVEGCFVIDTVHRNHSLTRRIVAGRRGRRDFIEAITTPWAVARGWVVRCDRDRELMLLRLVGVEVYSEGLSNIVDGPGELSANSSKQEDQASGATAADKPPQPLYGVDYLKRRLLRAEVDIGSSGIYAALPLAAIPRYEFIGGQSSGCCGRFVCAGTALRFYVSRKAALPGSLAASSGGPQRSNTGIKERLAKLRQPLLDEAALNNAHAHVEASLTLPDYFQDNPKLMELLQEPLGFAAALPHDAAHPQPQEEDFEEIRPLQLPPNGESREPLRWWDGGSGLLLSRLPFMLRSSGAFMNPIATHRRLHAFSALQMLGMAPPPETPESVASIGGPTGSGTRKKGPSNNNNRVLAFTEAKAWEEVIRRLSDGCFMSFLSTASPCGAIRIALARLEKDPAVRGGGVGRLLAQQQGADWAKRRLKAGVAYARRRQLDQAIQLYDSALQLRPDYADALIARGAAYANKLDYEKAAADLDAALTLEPTNKNAAKYRAIVAERMEGKEPQSGKPGVSGDRDRTPSPDRKCKSPEHGRLREISSTRATTIIRKGGPGSIPLHVSRNALTSAAAAANAVLEQAAASVVGRKGVGILGANSTVDRFRSSHEQQRQSLLLLEQQKRRAALMQQQLQHSQEMERQIEKKRREQLRQQEAQLKPEIHSSSRSTNRVKSESSDKKSSKGKKKRKHGDSSPENTRAWRADAID